MRSWVAKALVVMLALVMVSTAVLVVVSAPVRAAALADREGRLNGTLASPLRSPGAAPSVVGVTPEERPYWNKMTASVQDRVLTGTGTVDVAIVTDDVAAVGNLARRLGMDTKIGSVPSDAQGPRIVRLTLPSNLIEKFAALDAVQEIAPAVLPQAPSTDPDLPARSDPAPDMIQAGKGHLVPEAWALGFKGDGIRVSPMDSGVDFGHPDLQGTEARVTDPTSPYVGWPIAFDPNSMAFYLVTGATFPAVPGSWYVNTSFTSTATGGVLNTMFNGHTYNVAGVPSASGVYHLGLHPDKTLPYYYGERPAVLVTDSVTPGVYDKVYLDLNDDYVFGNDKSANVSDPELWADYYNATSNTWDYSAWDTGDGIADMSGGMIYFIADGTHPVPYSDVEANWYGLPLPIPTSGDLVAFMIGDAFAPGGDHGTHCASAIVAQNVTGKVLGFAPDAKIIAVGDIYSGGFFDDIWRFAAQGYDGHPGTGDEAQVASASFGTSNVDNDGWDTESRYVDYWSFVYQNTVFVGSTGNGGHGFGTVTEPSSSSSVISVGASTSYYLGNGFDPAAHSTFGDVQPWSNRGPSAMGQTKPDVVTIGAWATGDAALNYYGSGLEAWDVWGGTSLSAPATAAIVALIAEAWNESTGSPIPNFAAKLILDDAADNIHYDPQVMGHGLTNALRAVELASLHDGIVAFENKSMVPKADWTAGDYRGLVVPSFARIMHPGETNTSEFFLYNVNGSSSKTVSVSDWELQKIGTSTFTINASNANESAPDFVRPDYLINLTSLVPAGTNLVKATVSFPFSEFDPNGDYAYNSRWRVLLYDWKDYNGNRSYWNDLNGNGVVNTGEMDQSAGWEIQRFTYGYPSGTNIEAFVHDPLARVHDGFLLGIQHRTRSSLVPTTTLTVTVDYYKAVDAPWLSEDAASLVLPPGMPPLTGAVPLNLTVTLPANAPFGTLSAVVTVTDPLWGEMQIPVIVNVAASSTSFSFGGDPSSNAFLDNNRVFGGFDWSWRAESGDWRFFFTDIPDDTAISPGERLLVHTQWENVPTDLDTLIMGPTPDIFSTFAPQVWGPYTLTTVGNSVNTNIGGGTWRFQTATGGPEEWVAAPLSTGLHQIALHNVLYAGLGPSEVFSGQVGTFALAPSPWSVTTPYALGSGAFSVASSLDLPGLEVLSYGVSAPVYEPVLPITNGGAYYEFFNASHAGLIQIAIHGASSSMDIDLYLQRWTGTAWRTVASSTSPTANEQVRLTMPADGYYRIWVDGYSVPAGTDSFALYKLIVSGTNLTPTDVPTTPIAGGTPASFNVAWNFTGFSPGTYTGIMFVGPSGAPAIEVEATFNLVDPGPWILSTVPAAGASTNSNAAHAEVRYHASDFGGPIVAAGLAVDGYFFPSRWNQTDLVMDLPFALSDGTHRLNVTLVDDWGTPSFLDWSFTVDTTGPSLSVTSPDRALTNNPSAVVAGWTDPGAKVTIDGTATPVAGDGSFSAQLHLSEGSNPIVVVATDPSGNTATVVKMIVLDTVPPPVAITAPASGFVLDTPSESVHATGTAEVGASLTVNGQAVAVSGSGTWAVDLVLSEASPVITATATDAAGNSATATRTVGLDTTAPVVTVTAPANGGSVDRPTVTVTGTVDDPTAMVLVNGIVVAPGTGGSWSVNVALVNGTNTITVSAVDPMGNRATPVVLTVTYTSPVPGLQNGIDSNTNSINGLSGNLLLGLVAVLVVALAAIGAVYFLLSRKIAGGKKPEPPMQI